MFVVVVVVVVFSLGSLLSLVALHGSDSSESSLPVTTETADVMLQYLVRWRSESPPLGGRGGPRESVAVEVVNTQFAVA